MHLCRPDVATDLDETVAGEEGAEANEIADDKSAVTAFQRGPDETAEAYAKRIFQRVFEEDILKVLSMEVCPAMALHSDYCTTQGRPEESVRPKKGVASPSYARQARRFPRTPVCLQ